MIRLAQPVVDRRVIPGLYALAILFSIDVVRQTFDGLPLIGQTLLVLEAAAATLMIGWYLIIGHLRRTLMQNQGLIRLQALRMTAILGLFILTAGLLAGVLGYMRLARLLVSEILGGGALALAFYAFYRVATEWWHLPFVFGRCDCCRWSGTIATCWNSGPIECWSGW